MYSAVSVVDGLKKCGEIECEGFESIACPNPEPSCERQRDCVIGAAQECKQRIKVYRDYKLLIVLTVHFKVSPGRKGGFIRKDDSSLTRMVRHGYLDKQLLKTA
ncbi:MAG: hypothetical protein LBG27_09980 [Spirochaetaceae bacterium]|jgi:hypothetical protein|nr:hypothetical protein [Spirochaetaceae bacterium]